MANEIRIRITAEDKASAPIANVKASTIAAGAAMGTVLADVGRRVLDFGRDAVMSFAETGSAVFDMSQKTGLGAEALSELKFAAEQSGSSMDAVGIAVKRMNTNLFELSAGSESTKDTFAALGLTLNDVLGKSVSENFDLILSKLADVGDKSTQSALAVQLFGKSGTDMLPMLAEGAAGLDAMRARAHELGIVFSAEAAAKADALGDTMDELKDRVHGLGFQLGAALGPALVRVATVMVNLVTAISQNQYALAALAGVIGGGLLLAIGAFVASIGWIPLAIAAAVGAVSAGVLWIVRHFDAIQEAWFNLWDAMPGPIKTVWEGIKSFLSMLMDGFKTAVNFVIDLLNKIQIPDWVPVIGGKGINIPHIEQIGSAIGDLVMAGVGAVKSLKDVSLGLSGGAAGAEGGGLTDAANAAGAAVDELVERMQRAAERIQEQQTSEIVDAFLRGGMAQVEVVRGTHRQLDETWKTLAKQLHEKLGIEVPDEFRGMWESILKEQKDAARKMIEEERKLTESRLAEQSRLQFGATKTLFGMLGPEPSQMAVDSALAAAAAAARNISLGNINADLAAGKIDAGQAARAVQVIINGDVYGYDDFNKKVADGINQSAITNGPVIAAGAVAS